MNEDENNTSAAFREVVLKKVESQDKQIAALDEKVNNIPDNMEQIQMVISTLEGLRHDVQSNRFPIEKVQDFIARLDLNTSLLKAPVKKEIVHHHHIPKIILISVGFLSPFPWCASGWYMTSSKLDGYIANDTKYRQLRLDTSIRSLQHYLDRMIVYTMPGLICGKLFLKLRRRIGKILSAWKERRS